ncbi:MAG: hypothetical protein M1600_16135 [Firmicutes bacterium]|jgi:hypothetical protein|nr:hypothetical protein [Bacillota bacterium]
MKKYLWPLSGLMVTVLAGVVVMVGPFALHLNLAGHWTRATETMFWSGVGIIVVGVLGLLMWQRELSNEIANAMEPMHSKEEEALAEVPEAVAEPSGEEKWETELAKLAEAVLMDLKSEVETPKPKEVAPDDLQAVASALLQDLSQRMDQVGVDAGRGGRY